MHCFPAGLKELSPEQDSVITNMPVRNRNSRSDRILPETVALLRDFYGPFNQKLAQLLQDDRWEEPLAFKMMIQLSSCEMLSARAPQKAF